MANWLNTPDSDENYSFNQISLLKEYHSVFESNKCSFNFSTDIDKIDESPRTIHSIID